jgi:hydrophobic/amphiphilic exporter-1 (mainly G- bacteria), HAE1 family
VMTLFGLALGVGMLIDNSIVVFENILKKREQGTKIVNASVDGAGEMFLSMVASTITNVIVFLPLVFVGQELQRLYSGMAVTIVVSLILSLFCAMSLVPTMASRKSYALSIDAVAENSKTEEGSWMHRFAKFERRFLFRSIRRRRSILWISGAILVVSMFFLSRLGTEYLGSTEQKKFTAFIELPTGARLEASDKIVKKVEEIVRRVPEVKVVTSRVEPWSSKVYVELVDAFQRKRSTDEVIDALRQETNKMAPAFIYFQKEEQVGTKEVVIEVFGHNYAKLRELAIAIANRMESVRGLSDTKIRMREGRPEMQVLINKRQASLHNLSVKDTGDQVHGQMRGFRATVFHSEGREVETITRLDEKYRKTFKDLHNLIMTTKKGDSVLLDQIANFKFDLGPSEIWRKDRNRMIQVSSNIGKVPLSRAVGDLEKRLKDLTFPEDYFYRIGGDYPTLVQTSKQMKLMIIAVLVLIYLVLASLFESFYQPLLIMVAVPLALVGAVLALYLGPKSIGVGAMLGMMMLGGIVVNISIMLMDRINYYVQQKKMSPVKAAVLANKDRLRPIMMTMSGTVLGLIPMAIDKTEGANLWSPLAMTVIGGVVSSTLLTLMVTPAFYILFQDAGKVLKSGRIQAWVKTRLKTPQAP